MLAMSTSDIDGSCNENYRRLNRRQMWFVESNDEFEVVMDLRMAEEKEADVFMCKAVMVTRNFTVVVESEF